MIVNKPIVETINNYIKLQWYFLKNKYRKITSNLFNIFY